MSKCKMSYQIPGANGQWAMCDSNGGDSNSDSCAVVFIGPFRLFVSSHVPPSYRADMTISYRQRSGVLLGNYKESIDAQKREALLEAKKIFINAGKTCHKLLKGSVA